MNGKTSLETVQRLMAELKKQQERKPVNAEGDAILVHTCQNYSKQYEGYQPAISNGEVHHRAGMSFVSNTQGATQVYFCPWCGQDVHFYGMRLMKAHIDEVNSRHDEPDTQTPAPAGDPLPS